MLLLLLLVLVVSVVLVLLLATVLTAEHWSNRHFTTAIATYDTALSI
jgi:hypothetical protein